MSTTRTADIRRRGHPLPMGLTVLAEGVNFSLFARHATGVSLVVDFSPGPEGIASRREFALDPGENRTGDLWHILLAIKEKDFTYGYRLTGPEGQGQPGLVFFPDKILIDPYAHALRPRLWGEVAEHGQTTCCRVVTHDFDWQNDRPLKTPLAETIIYELHVRGFTHHPSSGVSAPGTFRGVIEKIPYLQKLGVTAVELMPVTAFDENDTVFFHPQSGERLKNFWGYNPVSFFALHPGYAADPAAVVDEFKTMVLTLHQAGIEVYLDMVYNHTGEGGYSGTTSSFRGIDNPVYYLLDEQADYLNYSGCGNTVNCNHPVVRHLIRDSLRYWVTEMHIDGFRFDLASILGRDRQGRVLPNPPMIEAIGEDPVLRDTKLIAEAWDAAGLYQVGSFSSDPRWAEWNGRFRDDVRAFMISKENSITHLATRIAGSSDLYQPSGRSPLCSINFVTCHDGFTLADLVGYNQKQNLANGEENRDGDNHNLSWNSGHEGPGEPPRVQRLRMRRMKSFSLLLLLSQGVPMICAGDEFGRSQGGNNNAWCQDNPTSWLDWSLLTSNRGFFRFFTSCIALRKAYPHFRREDFFPTAGGSQDAEILWQYLRPGEENWSADCHGLGFLLRPAAGVSPAAAFFVAVNGDRHTPLHFTLPDPPVGNHWYRIIDTAALPPADFLDLGRAPRHRPERPATLLPYGCMVFQSSPGSRQAIPLTDDGTIQP